MSGRCRNMRLAMLSPSDGRRGAGREVLAGFLDVAKNSTVPEWQQKYRRITVCRTSSRKSHQEILVEQVPMEVLVVLYIPDKKRMFKGLSDIVFSTTNETHSLDIDLPG